MLIMKHVSPKGTYRCLSDDFQVDPSMLTEVDLLIRLVIALFEEVNRTPMDLTI
jgi:hypothetical protein